MPSTPENTLAVPGVTGAGEAGFFAKLAGGLSAFAPKANGPASSEPGSQNYDPFASADDRHRVWSLDNAKPVLMAQVPMGVGGGNTQAMSQLKELDQEQGPALSPDKTQKAQMKALYAVDATQGILQQTTGTPSAYSKVPIQSADRQAQSQNAKAKSIELMDKKLGIGQPKPGPAGETEDQRNRRLHPELY